jgi:hypothetical protein
MQLGAREKCRKKREQGDLQEETRLEKAAMAGWIRLRALA